MSVKLAQVDAFTDRAFAGNPAAVCLLQEPASDLWMQNLAKEMNLATTAFLLPERANFNLRWFSPGAELKLCGHATLAAAHMLWEWNLRSKDEPIKFASLSGQLSASATADWIELDFPAEPADLTATYPDVLLKALGLKAAQVLRNRLDYLVVLESEQAVKELMPDFKLLMEVDSRGVIVTARSASGDVDFVSRFFSPQMAIDEDQVTGSAHCCLAPYWASELKKSELIGYQHSQRGGTVRIRIAGGRAFLSGKAVTIFSGELSAAGSSPALQKTSNSTSQDSSPG